MRVDGIEARQGGVMRRAYGLGRARLAFSARNREQNNRGARFCPGLAAKTRVFSRCRSQQRKRFANKQQGTEQGGKFDEQGAKSDEQGDDRWRKASHVMRQTYASGACSEDAPPAIGPGYITASRPPST